MMTFWSLENIKFKKDKLIKYLVLYSFLSTQN